MQRRLKNKLRKFILFGLGLYLMIGSLIYFFQEKLLFLPTVLEQDYQFEFQSPFEELFFKTDEDAVINALHFKAESPKGILLYFHGNAGDLSRWGKLTEYFVALNYDVLVMDYRTYGKSSGKLSERAFYEDAEYCYNYLLKDYSESEITLYGRSLGTGIASYVASKHNPRQLILETPYFSIQDVAKDRFPVFPVKPLLKYRFPTFEYLKETSCPITIIHGTDDSVVPYASGKKLGDLHLENLNFVTIEGGQHNNLVAFESYHETIKSCLK